MKKPAAAAIRAVTPLTGLVAALKWPDPFALCNLCGRRVDPDDLPLAVWREHDEHDKPIEGNAALIFVGRGTAHAACQKTIDSHPRLYSEEAGNPGHFPGLCVPCVYREGLACMHKDLKAHGGPGLAISLEGLSAIICSRGHKGGCHTPMKHPVKCAGRRTLKLLEESNGKSSDS